MPAQNGNDRQCNLWNGEATPGSDIEALVRQAQEPLKPMSVMRVYQAIIAKNTALILSTDRERFTGSTV